MSYTWVQVLTCGQYGVDLRKGKMYVEECRKERLQRNLFSTRLCHESVSPMDASTSYCGLTCSTCPILTATLEPDDVKRESLRASIALTGNQKYGLSWTARDINDCDGCKAGGRLFVGCSSCEVRRCAIERRLESCAYCVDYGCEKLQQCFALDPDARVHLEALRSARKNPMDD